MIKTPWLIAAMVCISMFMFAGFVGIMESKVIPSPEHEQQAWLETYKVKTEVGAESILPCLVDLSVLEAIDASEEIQKVAVDSVTMCISERLARNAQTEAREQGVTLDIVVASEHIYNILKTK